MKNGFSPGDFPFESGIDFIEIRVNHECVTLPLDRYEMLVKAEAQLEIAKSLYAGAASAFDVDGLLKPLFGAQPRHEPTEKRGAIC